MLTIQQFERAALLICCCEAIRRQSPGKLGTDSISIGLWLGKGATPNTLSEARESLNKLRAGRTVEAENPVQLHSCPWCGTALDHRNYWITKDDPRRLIVSCWKDDCAFGKGLPVYIVDEDVYRYGPTLIIATVDKFAGLPWREQAACLFNADGRTTDALRPELVIQDELHLISGPLGTLVGLYETALDAACAGNGTRPKIVASTATIRRASQQSRGLFNRDIRQFPPPGLEVSDSYFAIETCRDEKGSRMYLGLMAPGTSHTTLMVRSYAAILQGLHELGGCTDEVKDAYWTLVGYFNSLRVLGGARMQVQDDVEDRIGLLATRNGTTKRNIDVRIELTSRESSSDIPKHLKHMRVAYPDPDAINVILATNMISVGVDIDRLGLMVVMGQPQATSEYIQSTSRVGRQFPGLVPVLFNATRSRDRSHYESFIAYHSALYRQVESTSVTPFSARARDRGLHAVLVAMVRLLVPALRPNKAAANVGDHLGEVNRVIDLIASRIESVSRDEAEAARRQLEEVLSVWIKKATDVQGLVYSNLQDTSRSLLLDASEDMADLQSGFPTLWSLRDVDKESNLYLLA